MTSTPVEIVNAALNQLGAGLIQDFNEQTNRAITANLHYNRARLGMLRDDPWTFALKRTTLAEIATSSRNLPPVAEVQYEHVYQLPPDLLLLWRVEDDHDFRKEGTRILSRRDTAEILYTADIEDPALFDPKFEEALVAKLTYEMAYAITRDTNLRNDNYAFYVEKIQSAKFSNAIEDIEEQIDIDNQAYLDVRFR